MFFFSIRYAVCIEHYSIRLRILKAHVAHLIYIINIILQ